MDNLSDAFFRNLDEVGKDRKETCIHCGKEWYSIHYKDGVCPSCQALGKPGISKIEAKGRFIETVFYAIISLIILLILYFLIF